MAHPTPSDYAHKHMAFLHLKVRLGQTSNNIHSAGHSSGSGYTPIHFHHRWRGICQVIIAFNKNIELSLAWLI